jgi:Uncharacterized protein involved in cytokinesis, contains TGc (transglutaminase/protease-like) domain
MKNSSLINKILIVVIVLLALFFVSKFTGIGPFGSKVPSKDVCTSLEDVADKINEMLDGGEEGILTIYIKDLNESDLTKINFYLDTLKGNVTNIKTTVQDSKLTKVELSVNRSDASYVLDSIRDRKEIPAEKTNAIVLEKKVKDILNKYVKFSMTDFEKELAIHDYIVNNCTYGFFNDGSEKEYSAYGALVEGKAVCSGYAAAMDLLLKCAGVESRFVVGYAESSQRQADNSNISADNSRKNLKADNHAWNQVKIDGIWYNVDATWDDPVGEGPMLSHIYFNIDDELMSYTHDWKKDKYEKCDSMGSNYYGKTGTEFRSVPEMEAYCNYYFASGNKALECRINGFNVDNDNLQFLFGINGVNGVGYAVMEMGDYRILNINVQ